MTFICLAGAHTVGRTSCAQITSRLYNFPGSTTGADPALDVDYAHHLQQLCPQNGNPNVIVPLDPVSPNTFDNMYYTNGVTGRVMFASDNALFLDHQTEFASNLNSQNGEFWQVHVLCTDHFMNLNFFGNISYGNPSYHPRKCIVRFSASLNVMCWICAG